MNPLETQVGGDHYRSMKIQPAEFIHANGIPFLEGCVIKYACRHRAKGKADDIRKAIHFLELLLRLEYKADMQTEPAAKTTQEKLESDTGQKLDLKMCLDQYPLDPFCLCTRPAGHDGSHVAGNPNQPNIAVWDDNLKTPKSQVVHVHPAPHYYWRCRVCGGFNPVTLDKCDTVGCSGGIPK